MESEHIIAVVAVACLFGGPILWLIVDSIASNWRKVQEAEQAAALKRDMIERGFDADEIIRVIEAGTPGASKRANKSSQAVSSR